MVTASAWVAVAAIVVASIFNIVTLKRSSKTLGLAEQSFTRTEERYQADRLDARNDRLRDAVIDVAVAVTAFNRENAWFVKLLMDFATGHAKAGAAQDQDVQKLRPAAAETYRAIQLVLFLTDDVEITTLVRDIENQVFAATNLVSTHELSPSGIASAATEFGRYRKIAAAKSTQLLDTTHKVVNPST